MAGNPKSLFRGVIQVIIPQKLGRYEAFEKEYPDSLKKSPDFQNYNWLGNFGLREKTSGRQAGRTVEADYEIQVEKRAGQKLVYWDGSQTVEFTSARHGLKDVPGTNHLSAKLNLGDPPVGWTN